jgi:hypothetical protein
MPGAIRRDPKLHRVPHHPSTRPRLHRRHIVPSLHADASRSNFQTSIISSLLPMRMLKAPPRSWFRPKPSTRRRQVRAGSVLPWPVHLHLRTRTTRRARSETLLPIANGSVSLRVRELALLNQRRCRSRRLSEKGWVETGAEACRT